MLMGAPPAGADGAHHEDRSSRGQAAAAAGGRLACPPPSRPRPARRRRGRGRRAADPSATVELSSTAATLLSGGASAEFDAEKVARMTKRSPAARFKINADAIADKLIANAQELLIKVKG